MIVVLWSSLFRGGKTEERLSVDDWAEMFSFNGNSYPFMGTGLHGSNTETIDNDFIGYVQGAYKSSGVVFACMLARQLVFSEARFQYQQLNGGRPGDLFDSRELAILEKPWPNGDTGELLVRALQDADLAAWRVKAAGGADYARTGWTSLLRITPSARARAWLAIPWPGERDDHGGAVRAAPAPTAWSFIGRWGCASSPVPGAADGAGPARAPDFLSWVLSQC
ncbi:hypothetical protein [Streptomyces nigrescens]